MSERMANCCIALIILAFFISFIVQMNGGINIMYGNVIQWLAIWGGVRINNLDKEGGIIK